MTARRVGTCTRCGVQLRRSWTGDGLDLGGWLDDAGNPWGGRAESWHDLLDALGDVGGRSDRVVQLYASAKVGLGMHSLEPWRHWHAAEVEPWAGGQVPECCGWPMRLIRDGWTCRRHCGAFLGRVEVAA